MHDFLGFRQVQAQFHRAVDLQTISFTSCRNGGLNREAVFVEIQQFVQVHGHRRRAVEADVNGSLKFLTDAAATLTVGREEDWIRQSESAPIHDAPY